MDRSSTTTLATQGSRGTRRLALLIGALLGAVAGGGLWLATRPVLTYTLELRVTDEQGRPVESFGWQSGVQRSGGPLPKWVREAHHPGGIALAEDMPIRGALKVFSTGYKSVQFERFVEGDVPDAVEVTFRELEALTGFVTHAGEPVEGAVIKLLCEQPRYYDQAPAGRYFFYECNDERDTTGSDGSFRVRSAFENIRYFVRAEKAGFAPATVGWFRISETRDPVQVELHAGGEVEGRLRIASSHAAGYVAELYRNDSYREEDEELDRYSVQFDEQGQFRFEHVAPGPWMVRVRSASEDWGDVWRTVRKSAHIPFIVHVQENELAQVEVDQTLPMATAQGRLRLNGEPWVNAIVRLLSTDEHGFLLDVARPDERGHFVLRAREEGTYRAIVEWSKHGAGPPTQAMMLPLSRAGELYELDLEWEG